MLDDYDDGDDEEEDDYDGEENDDEESIGWPYDSFECLLFALRQLLNLSYKKFKLNYQGFTYTE